MNAFVVFIKRPVFATMLSLFLVVIGVLSYIGLGVDAMPNVDLPVVNIVTSLRGASPEEVEAQVTKPLEEAINTISGIDELRSYSLEGASIIPIQFVFEKSSAEAVQDVRDKVATAMRELPTGTDPPVVIKFSVDRWPVAGVAIAGARSLRELRELAEKTVKPFLETIDGVGQVSALGGWKRAVNVVLDSEKLRSLQISATEVATAIRNQHVDVPGGRIVRGDLEFGLRTMARMPKVSDFNELVIADRQGRQITLSDVGRAEDSYEDPRSLTRAWKKSAGERSYNSVILMIRKQTGTNTVAIVDKVFDRMKEIEKVLPKDVGLEMAWEQGRFIKASIDEVKFHLVIGAILASLVCFLFIRDWRATLIAATAIPTSIISTFALIKAMGYTINNMTMLALTLSVGVVIDDAIVVLENIYRQMEEEGKSPRQAAIDGLKEIALAVLATTFSLVVIFLPIAFMSGRIGMWFNAYGATVAFAILVSLVVSFTLTPMLCAQFLRVRKRRANRLYDLLDRIWGRLLRWALVHRWKTIFIGVGLFATTFLIFPQLKKKIVPRDDRNKFQVIVDLPEGSSLRYADQLVRKVEADLKKVKGVVRFFTVIGDRGRGVEDVTAARMWVSIEPLEQRDYTIWDVLKETRKLKGKYPGVKINARELGFGGGSAPIQVDIRGPDLKKLLTLSETMMARMRKIPGFVDVDSSLTKRSPEVQVRIDRPRASDRGVQSGEVALALRSMVGGLRIGRYLEGSEQYDIWLRVEREDRAGRASIGTLPMGSTKGGTVELRQLANLREGRGPQEIVRLNRKRTVTISANLEGLDMGRAMGALVGVIKSLKLPDGYETEFGGRGKMMQEMMSNLVIAFGLAFLFMYMILAAQFESFLHPITILTTLPLSLPCAFFSLWILNNSFNIYSALGLFMLFGIVKKNGILQIDYTNTLRRRGMRAREAILLANHTRFRPILMTTLTLIVGMIPIAVGTGPGSAARSSMAKVIIGGQALSLLISLLIVPVTYTLFDDLGNRIKYNARRGMRHLLAWLGTGNPIADHCPRCYHMTSGEKTRCESCAHFVNEVHETTLNRLLGRRNLLLGLAVLPLVLFGVGMMMAKKGGGRGGPGPAMAAGKKAGKGPPAAMAGGKAPHPGARAVAATSAKRSPAAARGAPSAERASPTAAQAKIDVLRRAPVPKTPPGKAALARVAPKSGGAPGAPDNPTPPGQGAGKSARTKKGGPPGAHGDVVPPAMAAKAAAMAKAQKAMLIKMAAPIVISFLLLVVLWLLAVPWAATRLWFRAALPAFLAREKARVTFRPRPRERIRLLFQPYRDLIDRHLHEGTLGKRLWTIGWIALGTWALGLAAQILLSPMPFSKGSAVIASLFLLMHIRVIAAGWALKRIAAGRPVGLPPGVTAPEGFADQAMEGAE